MRLFSIFTVILALSGPALAAETGPATITVTGEGQVEAVPDMATVSLGVTTEGDTASSALGANSDAVVAVIARLKAEAIEDRDIQTSGLSLGPRYDYGGSNGGQPKITGYVAMNTVTVRVRDIAAVGGVLDGVVSEGANTLNGLSFGLEDDAAALDEARRRAVADAVHKAALYAEAAGVKLGRVLSISEPAAVQLRGTVMMAEASFAKAGAADVPVASGEVNLGASVSIVYEIDE